MRRRSKHPLPAFSQFLMAPRMMRRISVWMLDHDLTFEEARAWDASRHLLIVHLADTCGPQWRRSGPAELVVLAGRAVDFDPKLLPYGVKGIYHPETLAAVRSRKPRSETAGG
ncbi:hypothetical protein [Kitasatospora sp. NPDC093102]|uniref:hypothetical protein n=1 Tax=Kitasatospora sp. NPDC093102 TaxID=3155069 RepID=UPI00343FC785